MAFGWNAWSPVNLTLDALVLFVGALCVRVLLRRAGGLPLRLERGAVLPLLQASLFAGALWFVAGIAVGGILGLSLFARALWTLFGVGIPLLLLWLGRRWRSVPVAALAALPLAVKFYGEVIEPARLDVERVQVPLPGITAPVRVAHLSDLQTDGIRGVEMRARAAANGFEPDIVVFTGDVLNHPSLVAEVREYLGGFRGRSGRFFVSGDVDGREAREACCGPGGFENLDGLREAVAETPGGRIALLGMALKDIAAREVVERFAVSHRAAAARLLLAHRPDAAMSARRTGVDLVLAGHTHGGQVALPVFGPVVTLTRMDRRIAAGGLHRFEDLWISLCRGLGWEGHIAPRVRFFARPHIILLELVPARR